MIRIFSLSRSVPGVLLTVSLLASDILSQTAALEKERQMVEGSDSRLWYGMFLLVALGLGLAAYFWRKSKKGITKPDINHSNRYRNYYSNESYDMEGLDAEKELEWLRKAKKSSVKTPAGKITYGAKKADGAKKVSTTARPDMPEELDFDTKIFQERMRKLQYAQLPINSFLQLADAKPYTPLPVSNDASLLNAIEQANEEFEEDENVRGLAVRILNAFRTRNSVDALSQIALYDLSSNLRSKAVAILADFDHESVFEAMLLACADPTREVRAAAARGLFRLNFDRANAWKRIIETDDEFRMSHAARAAIESGIVVKSFDRLVHEDLKVAYEAFALVALLVKAGETTEIFDAIRTHKDERVRFALVHVLKVLKDERTLPGLHEIKNGGSCPSDVVDRIKEAVESFEQVPA